MRPPSKIIRSGLTQEEVARRCGLNPTTLSHYLVGSRMPDFDTAMKIAKHTGNTPEALYRALQTQWKLNHRKFRQKP